MRGRGGGQEDSGRLTKAQENAVLAQTRTGGRVSVRELIGVVSSVREGGWKK